MPLKYPVTSEDHAQGSPDAAVTLVEYGDYECPYCGQAHPIVKQVRETFGDRLRFVFRNFPLTQAHPNAEAAAEVAEWAGSKGHFWEMHDALYENQDQFGLPLYTALAVELGLKESELIEVLETRPYQSKIKSEFSGGVRSGVNGTPAFFINGQLHTESFEFEDLTAAINAAFEGA